MFDSHCHLTDLEDPDEALREASSAGVGSVLTCGYHLASNHAVLRLVERTPNLPFAVGLHPWFANEALDDTLTLIRGCRPTAIGEAGLDLWDDQQPSLERQVFVLESQLQLAASLSLPVTIHSRKAVDVLLAVLRNHPQVRGALHAFSGSYEQLKPFLELGYFAGLGGAITRERAKKVRRLAQAAPLDRIVLETDAPAIGMAGVEPPHVRPKHLPRVLTALAELRNLSAGEVERQVDQNARRLFGDSAVSTPRPTDREPAISAK